MNEYSIVDGTFYFQEQGIIWKRQKTKGAVKKVRKGKKDLAEQRAWLSPSFLVSLNCNEE